MNIIPSYIKNMNSMDFLEGGGKFSAAVNMKMSEIIEIWSDKRSIKLE